MTYLDTAFFTTVPVAIEGNFFDAAALFLPRGDVFVANNYAFCEETNARLGRMVAAWGKTSAKVFVLKPFSEGLSDTISLTRSKSSIIGQVYSMTLSEGSAPRKLKGLQLIEMGFGYDLVSWGNDTHKTSWWLYTVVTLGDRIA